LSLTLAAALLSGTAAASPVDFHGFGAATMGRGAGGVALADDAASVFLNPAALTQLDGGQFVLGYAAIRYRFDALPDVSWDTNRDGRLTDADDPLTPDLPMSSADGIMIALGRPLGDRVGVALDVFIPKDRLFRLHTFETELPTYFMYENRPHRYALTGGAAVEPGGGLSLGAGVRMLPQVVIDAVFQVDMVVSGEAAGDSGQGSFDGAEDILSVGVDVNDITVDLVPGFAPTAGFQWELGAVAPALEGFSLGGTWRGTTGMPVDITLDMQVNAAAEDIGDLEPTTVAVILQGALELFDHYVPSQLQGGISYETSDTLSLYADVQYTRWEAFTLNVARLLDAELQASLLDLSELTITDGSGVSAQFRNTLGYRAGTEIKLPEWTLPGDAGTGRIALRGGFGYDPSPLAAQTDDTTLLDADRLIIALGAGFIHGEPFGLSGGPSVVDLFAQYQPLASAALTREAEVPTAGYPAEGTTVPIGGDLLAAGIQWRLDY